MVRDLEAELVLVAAVLVRVQGHRVQGLGVPEDQGKEEEAVLHDKELMRVPGNLNYYMRCAELVNGRPDNQ